MQKLVNNIAFIYTNYKYYTNLIEVETNPENTFTEVYKVLHNRIHFSMYVFLR